MPGMEIITADISSRLNLLPEALHYRDNLLERAGEVQAVTDALTQKAAAEVGLEIHGILADVEACRKQVKAPVLEVGARIDALAKEFAAPLTEQKQRIGKLVALFQEQEAARVAEAEAKRQAEITRLEVERFAAEQAARQAQAAMATEADLAKAIEAEAAAKKAAEAAYNQIAAPPPAPVKERGTATKKKLRWECTDLRAFVNWCIANDSWHLIKVEPSASGINGWLVLGMEVPGLKLWEETVSEFRRR